MKKKRNYIVIFFILLIISCSNKDKISNEKKIENTAVINQIEKNGAREFYFVFNDISGLEENYLIYSNQEIIGYLKKIELIQDKVRITARIKNEFTIFQNPEITIKRKENSNNFEALINVKNTTVTGILPPLTILNGINLITVNDTPPELLL